MVLAIAEKVKKSKKATHIDPSAIAEAGAVVNPIIIF